MLRGVIHSRLGSAAWHSVRSGNRRWMDSRERDAYQADDSFRPATGDRPGQRRRALREDKDSHHGAEVQMRHDVEVSRSRGTGLPAIPERRLLYLLKLRKGL